MVVFNKLVAFVLLLASSTVESIGLNPTYIQYSEL
jgi:hypothetical protein